MALKVDLTKADPLYWPCKDCKAKQGEPCKAIDDKDRPWLSNTPGTYEYHFARRQIAGFAKRWPQAINVPCSACGAGKNECCRPYNPNRFGKVSDYACPIPHRPRRLGIDAVQTCRVRDCGRPGRRVWLPVKDFEVDTVLCTHHEIKA